MTLPLVVTATLEAPIAGHDAPLHLDGLLAWALARESGSVTVDTESDVTDFDLPLARERGVWLCSVGLYEIERHVPAWVNRRFPLEHALRRSEMRRLNDRSGPTRSFRVPLPAAFLRDDRIVWFCRSDDPLRLLSLVSRVRYVGRKRSVGYGRVRCYDVAVLEDVWPGFPVLDPDGQPLRNLPEGWPGVAETVPLERVPISPPYWMTERAVPGYAASRWSRPDTLPSVSASVLGHASLR